MKKSGKSIQMALALLAVGTLLLNGCSAAKPAEKKSIRIGVTLYRGDDAFINNIRSSLEEKAKEYEQQTGIKVNLEIMDPKGNQNTQNSQVDRFLSLEYDAICVNMVDRSAASYVINKAMDAGRIFQPRTGRGGHETVGAPLLCRGGRAGIGGSAGRNSGGCVSGKSGQS